MIWELDLVWHMKKYLVIFWIFASMLIIPAESLWASEPQEESESHSSVVEGFSMGESFVRLFHENGLVLHIRKDLITGFSIYNNNEDDDQRSVRSILKTAELVPTTTHIGRGEVVLSYRYRTYAFWFESVEMAMEFSDRLMDETLPPVELPAVR